MNKTKVYGIKSGDFSDFIKKINDFYEKNEAIATQTHIDRHTGFYGVIYYKSGKVQSSPVSTSTKPIPQQKSDKPTPKQIAYLKKSKVKIPATKKEATQMISDYIKGLQEI